MTELLVGDLYHFQDLLSDDEAAVVERVRDFLAAEVVPIANDYWARAEFPYRPDQAVTPSSASPAASGPSLLNGWLALEMAHADASMATFFGVHSGLAMGSIARCGSRRAAGAAGCRRWPTSTRSARSR